MGEHRQRLERLGVQTWKHLRTVRQPLQNGDLSGRIDVIHSLLPIDSLDSMRSSDVGGSIPRRSREAAGALAIVVFSFPPSIFVQISSELALPQRMKADLQVLQEKAR